MIKKLRRKIRNRIGEISALLIFVPENTQTYQALKVEYWYNMTLLKVLGG